MKVSTEGFLVDWRQVVTPSSAQESMLVIDRRRVRREHRPPMRPIAHPELRYSQSRKLRDDMHPVFRWLKGVPLDVIDEKLGDIVVGLTEEDVRHTANGLSRSVKKLGDKGALELAARVGYLLSRLQRRI